MPRKPSQYIELSGPLFDDDVIRKFNDAVADGMEELGEEGASILGAAVLQRNFVKTGRFLRGIEAQAKRTSPGTTAGYVAVTVADGAWPEKDRPTKTWFERGTRNGVRLRTGGYGFRKTADRLKSFDFEQYFGGRIREALNG